MERSIKMNSENSTPNPYVLALCTALLSGFFAVLGIILTSSLQKDQVQLSKSLDFKVSTYNSFLQKVTKGKSEAVSQIEHVSLIVGNAHSEGEIQEVEDFVSDLNPRIDTEFLVELNQEFNLLRISGSDSIRRNVDDILSALILDTDNIDISNYPVDVQYVYVMYTPNIKKIDPSHLHSDARKVYDFVSSMPKTKVDYFEAKVSDEERFAIVLTAKLFQNLITSLRQEITLE